MEIKFDTTPSMYWSNVIKLTYVQRRILVHSILYYNKDQQVITDGRYDALCKQLLNLIEQSTDQEFRDSMYYYVFFDFDGSTGYHLYQRLTKHDQTYLTTIAEAVNNLKKSK